MGTLFVASVIEKNEKILAVSVLYGAFLYRDPFLKGPSGPIKTRSQKRPPHHNGRPPSGSQQQRPEHRSLYGEGEKQKIPKSPGFSEPALPVDHLTHEAQELKAGQAKQLEISKMLDTKMDEALILMRKVIQGGEAEARRPPTAARHQSRPDPPGCDPRKELKRKVDAVLAPKLLRLQ